MAYVGNQNYQAYVTLASQTFSVTSTTIYSLNYTVTNANNIALYINNVPQQPSVAYTAAGNTLTLTTATSSSMYAVYLGQGIQTTNLPTGVVSVSNLNASGTPGSTNFLRGDNSWNGVGINQLTATGTPGSTNFLRGDNSWTNVGIGKVLQVVSATTTTNTATTLTTFVSTALSASITPFSSSSKILIKTLSGSFYNVTVGYGCISTIYRNSIELSNSAYGLANVWSATARIQAPAVIGIYDNPATTSSITYTLRIKSENSSGTASHLPNNDLATIILMEIGS